PAAPPAGRGDGPGREGVGADGDGPVDRPEAPGGGEREGVSPLGGLGGRIAAPHDLGASGLLPSRPWDRGARRILRAGVIHNPPGLSTPAEGREKGRWTRDKRQG